MASIRKGAVKTFAIGRGQMRAVLGTDLRFGSAAGLSDPYWSNVVALWPFDEANGATTFTDRSSKGHTLTVSNAGEYASSARAKFGSTSLRVDIAGDLAANYYLWSESSTDLNLSGDFTIDAWVYFYGQSDPYMGLLSRQFADTTDGAFWISRSLSTGKIEAGVWESGARTAASNAAINSGTWYHIAVERQSGTLRLYVDGVLQTATAASSLTVMGPILELGRGNNASDNQSWDGHVQDLRVTKGVARYGGASFTPPTSFYPRS